MLGKKNELQYPLDDLKKVVHKWMYLENDEVIDVMIATHIANKFKADPVWMIIIGPPSHTKTELLRAFDKHPDVYFLSNLTPATLVSGIKPKNGVNDPSLLPKLNDKTLILKDFTTLLSMRSEQQQEIIAQFREIYDGRYTKVFGTGKKVDWQGRVGLIAACTPIYDKHYGMIGTLGDRFLLYRCDEQDNEKMGLQAHKIVGREDVMRDEIRTAVHKFINQFSIADIHFTQDEQITVMIIQLACFVAIARCPVDRDRYSGAVEYEPMPEGSARLVKQITQIGMALAMIHGKTCIDAEIYDIVKKIGRDLISAQRLKIIKQLWTDRVMDFLDEWRTTKEIAEALNRPSTTTVRLLEDLMVVEVLKRTRDGEADNSPYQWQLARPVCDMIETSEVLAYKQYT